MCVLRIGLGLTRCARPCARANEGTYVMGIQSRACGAALALAALMQVAQAQDTTPSGALVLPPIDVGSSRLGSGIVGTSTSVITSEEIARAPKQTLTEIIAEQAGVQ